MATNAAWSNPLMWRVAGALNALRREIEKSRAVVEASVMARLDRQHNSLERRHQSLVSEARRIPDATQEERDALTQRIIQFYRDVGELERVAESMMRGAM
jgi:hypothetical protein